MDPVASLLVFGLTACVGLVCLIAYAEWQAEEKKRQGKRAAFEKKLAECDGNRQVAELLWIQDQIAEVQFEKLCKRMRAMPETQFCNVSLLQYVCSSQTAEDMALMGPVTTGRISLLDDGKPMPLVQCNRRFLETHGFAVSADGAEAIFDEQCLAAQLTPFREKKSVK